MAGVNAGTEHIMTVTFVAEGDVREDEACRTEEEAVAILNDLAVPGGAVCNSTVGSDGHSCIDSGNVTNEGASKPASFRVVIPAGSASPGRTVLDAIQGLTRGVSTAEKYNIVAAYRFPCTLPAQTLCDRMFDTSRKLPDEELHQIPLRKLGLMASKRHKVVTNHRAALYIWQSATGLSQHGHQPLWVNREFHVEEGSSTFLSIVQAFPIPVQEGITVPCIFKLGDGTGLEAPRASITHDATSTTLFCDSIDDRVKVAVVGGGFAGAVAAKTLADFGIAVTVFDQGRRGFGGRASHRRLESKDGALVGPILDDSDPPDNTLEFDHGCQFFRAETARFATVVERWEKAGLCGRWEGRFASVGAGADFFGFDGAAASGAPYFAGIGGNHRLPRALLEGAGPLVTLRRGTRISAMRPATAAEPRRWALEGTSGVAAFHDTVESVAAAATAGPLGEFDAVLVTDVSASFDGWHRASAGVPAAVGKKISTRVRVPLFSCMVQFSSPLNSVLQEKIDGLVVNGKDEVVWFAARTRSKPGYSDSFSAPDCWTIVSTPGYAAKLISDTPMQDPETGAFIPQSDEYLNTVPGPALLEAFVRLVRHRLIKGRTVPAASYLQAQRWGSAFPAPAFNGGRDRDGASSTTKTLSGTRYETGALRLRCDAIDEAASTSEPNYFADDGLRIYYASDYVSRHTPGVEASCLSALDAAEHIAQVLKQGAEITVASGGGSA